MRIGSAKYLIIASVLLVGMIKLSNTQKLLAEAEIVAQVDESGVMESIDKEQALILKATDDDPDRLDIIDETRVLNLEANKLSILPRFCTGKCYLVDMNFPANSMFKGTYQNWQVSHGTPTVNTNSVWMWSANNIGEGINLRTSFQSGRDYCIETLLTLSRNGSAPTTANANIDLTDGPILGSTASLGTPIPPITALNQQLLQQPYSNLATPHTQNYVMSFTAANNFSNIWFHPYSPSSQVNMQILKVKICEQNDPCDFNIRVSRRGFCGFAKFYALVYTSYGLNIVGYNWNFGDGATSNEAYPSHFYSNPGVYIVTLKVTVKNSNGECCTKTYSFRMYVKPCDPCKTLNYATIKSTNYGSLIKFEPTVPSSYGPMFYEWSFSDGTYYSTREVWKSSIPWSASLTIYYISEDSDRPCCSVTLKRRFWFLPLGNLVFEYPYRNIVAPTYDNGEIAQRKLAEISKADGFSQDELEDSDLIELPSLRK